MNSARDTSTSLSAGGSVLLKESFDGSSWTWTELPAYFGGEHLATNRPSSWWKFTFRDHLGTMRVEANGNGTINAAPDFYPFGMERTSTSPLDDQLFTD